MRTAYVVTWCGYLADPKPTPRLTPDRPAAVAEVERLLGRETVRALPENTRAVREFLEGRQSCLIAWSAPFPHGGPFAFVTEVEVP